jgi:GR25 family glycosyltransferase involved in LPS biosynthesis
MLPNVYFICLETKFLSRGKPTMEFFEAHVDNTLYKNLVRFNAVTPNEFDVEVKASTQQVAIIKGRKERVVHADMSSKAQVACALSHITLWKLCADTNQPIVIIEDDVMHSNMSRRLKEAYTMTGDVVLLCCASNDSDKLTKKVKSFVATGAYYLTPNGAKTLLKHALPVSMHVDYYMSTCIAAYDLRVLSVANSDDQWDMPSSKLSTLEHTKTLFDIQVPRLELVVLMLAIILFICCVIFGGCGVSMVYARRRERVAS